MILYLRLFIIILKSICCRKKISINDKSYLEFRVWPHDCDHNMHLTNSRYIAFMDLASIWMIAEMNLLGKIAKKKWLPILNSQEITYIRGIRPFQRFTIESRVAGWDEKYFYIRQHFISGTEVYAKAMVRGLFVKKGTPVPIEKLTEMMGNPLPPDDLKERINLWVKVIQMKKD